MPGGRKPYEPNEKDRRVVEMMAACGIPQDRIARVLGIDAKTLRKHYRPELDTAADKVVTQTFSSLVQKATTEKNVTAMIFLLKTKGGFRETTRIEHSGPNGRPLLPMETARALLDRGADSRPPEDDDEEPIKK